jgi:hypothetical protein
VTEENHEKLSQDANQISFPSCISARLTCSMSYGAFTHPCVLGTMCKINTTFRVSLSYGENCTLVAYIDFYDKVFMWSFFLRQPVLLINLSTDIYKSAL